MGRAKKYSSPEEEQRQPSDPIRDAFDTTHALGLGIIADLTMAENRKRIDARES